MDLIEDCIHTPASPEAEWGPLSPRPCWGIPAASETSSPLQRAGWTWGPEDGAALWATRSGPTLRHQTALLAEEEQKKWVTVFTQRYNQKGLKHTAWLGQTSDIRLLQSHACSSGTSPGRVNLEDGRSRPDRPQNHQHRHKHQRQHFHETPRVVYVLVFQKTALQITYRLKCLHLSCLILVRLNVQNFT